MSTRYPENRTERDQWVLDRRPARNAHDAYRPNGFFVEDECTGSGQIEQVATILLTNRECPWRCVMCDLWQNTLEDVVPDGAIAAQIEYALPRMPPVKMVKLYNAGSFFDHRAIPVGDYAGIAAPISGMERVVVESHPALVGADCLRLRDLLSGQLEVAMGLETIELSTLERLNKGMTLAQFAGAAQFLTQVGIGLRVFVMVQPPFMRAMEALHWAERSIEFAFDAGASTVSLIPTRGGNGAMEDLARSDQFAAPSLAKMESALDYGLRIGRGIVTVDLWDIERLRKCHECFPARVERLRRMNLDQTITEQVVCGVCKGES